MPEVLRHMFTDGAQNDQASRLRALAAQQYNAAAAAHRRPRIVTITSGKGGVGKTHIVSNMAIVLAQLGKQTLLVDADTNMGNVELLLGLSPKYRLSHVINKECAVEDAVLETYNGLRVIPGDSGNTVYPSLSDRGRERLFSSLTTTELPTDLLLIDTSAGVSDDVLYCATHADDTIIITTPEPTAVMDAYAMIKLITYSPVEIKPQVHIIINMANNLREAEETFYNLQSVTSHFLHAPIRHLGSILNDAEVKKAVHSLKPFVIQSPHCGASLSLRAIAMKLFQPNFT